MSRARHCVVRVRRPLAPAVAGAAVAATMLAGPLLLAAVPAGSAAPEPSDRRPAEYAAVLDPSAILRRDEAQASRGVARPSAAPTPAPATPAAVPATPAPVPAAPASAPPAPSAAPVAAPVVVGRLWVTTAVNVRSGPSSSSDRVGSLAALDQVDVTGTTTDGWTQVVLEAGVGWVNGSYLSETEPAPAAATEEAAGTSDAPCSISTSIESHLSSNARAVYRAVCAAHGGSVSAFGGYRPGDDGDHGSGNAVDIMVSGDAGWEIARFLQARTGELGITYLIYQQQYWPAGSPTGAWEAMEDRGGVTANHFDHVHVSVG